MICSRVLASLIAGVLYAWVLSDAVAQPKHISGIYPHLAMFNEEAECGTGAVVPWGGRLWCLTYAPHKPEGSSDKLYEITPELKQIIRPESIGGTPANRMIHHESGQLFIGPYAISTNAVVRPIPYTRMFGRPTGTARHLTKPADKVVYATMEEGFYEVDVHTLEVRELWTDEQRPGGRKANLPGYHGKGFYSGQGRYVYANNGDHSAQARTNPAAPSGALAEWDGKAESWQVVRRNQFTEVTGPGGLEGNSPADDRIWTIGWDHRSLILMLLEEGKWHSYRLPKASHSYDGGHGWNTEWPRIRDIGESDLLMTMHGSFWKFPRTFSVQNSAGIAPRSTYLKVIGDFCRWQERVVFGCDDTARSEFLNKSALKGSLAAPGKSQSNLWFVEPGALDQFGPAMGRGAIWLNDAVKSGSPSEPYLFSGYSHRALFLAHRNDHPVPFTLQVDVSGKGKWTTLRKVTVPPHGSVWTDFGPGTGGTWIRLIANRDASDVSAVFHYRGDDTRTVSAAPIFEGVGVVPGKSATGGILHVGDGSPGMLRFLASDANEEAGCYGLNGEMRLTRINDSEGTWLKKNAAILTGVITADDASALYVDESGARWRLPKNADFDQAGPLGPERVCREVCTERNLLNVHGTFYELPANNAGGFSKLRPIATHNRRIVDFASYRGLLVLSGVTDGAQGERIIRSDDNRCALWVGVVDDLWNFGKPRGTGGPWKNTAVQANEPSDPYLMTGYDFKRVQLSHTAKESVRMRVEVDITGTGVWVTYSDFKVPAGKKIEHTFPESFGAYWVRVTSNHATRATAQFIYY